MSGIAVTLAVSAAPQGGQLTVKCSDPTDITGVGSAISDGLLTVTTTDGDDRLLGVNQIIEVVNIA